jgi:hypothetical protein
MSKASKWRGISIPYTWEEYTVLMPSCFHLIVSMFTFFLHRIQSLLHIISIFLEKNVIL